MPNNAKKTARQAGSQRSKKPVATAASHEVQAGQPVGDAWERFWYQPQSYGMLIWLRRGLGLAACLFFASYWSDIANWFSASGLLPTERLGRLVASTGAEEVARWQFSLLYGIDSPILLRTFLVIGMISAILVGVGRLGRGAILVCWVCLLSLANRQWVVVGLVEFPLTLGLLGLTIAGSGRGLSFDQHQPTNRAPATWQIGLGKRILQVQAALLATAIAAAQTLRGEWLSGEGFARLLTAGAGRIIDLSAFAAYPAFARLAGLLLVAIPWGCVVAFALGLWLSSITWRRSAVVTLMVYTMCVAGLADQWLYGLALVSLLVSLVPAAATFPTD